MANGLPINWSPQASLDSDIFIHAGYENTPETKTGGKGPLVNEIDWPPMATNERTRILRKASVSTIRKDAGSKRLDSATNNFFGMERCSLTQHDTANGGADSKSGAGTFRAIMPAMIG